MLNTNKDSKIKDKKLSRKTKTIFWCLVIIFGMIGGYKILSNSPPTNSIAENNLIQGHVWVTDILERMPLKTKYHIGVRLSKLLCGLTELKYIK